MGWNRKIEKIICFTSVRAVASFRPRWATNILLYFFRRWGMKFTGMPNYISSKTWFDGTDYSLITIGHQVTISSYIRVLTHDWALHTVAKAFDIKQEKPLGRILPVTIGDYSFIGTGSILMPGCEIGKGCIIGAGTVVRGKVPDFSIYSGSPGKVIGSVKSYLEKKWLRDQLMIYIIFSVLASISIAIIIFMARRKGVAQLFINPIVLSTMFYLLIHLIMPVAQWNVGYFRYESGYDEQTYAYSLVYAFILHVAYVTPFVMRHLNLRPTLLTNEFTYAFLKRLLIACMFAFFVGIAFCIENIHSILAQGIADYISDRITFGASNGIDILLAYWSYISCLVFFFIYKKSNEYVRFRRISFVMFIISFIASAIYFSLNSNRNSIFIMLISLIAIYFSIQSRLYGKLSRYQVRKFIVFPLIAVAAIFLFYNIGLYRHSNVDDTYNSNNYSVIDSLNGAFGNHENLVWLMSNRYTLSYGETYLAGFENFIPRSIWPDKPYGGGPTLKNAIYPGSYVLGQEGNSSLTTGLVTECFLNFGYVGGFLCAMFLGWLVSMLFIVIKKSKSTAFQIFYVLTVVLFSSQFYYAEFLGFFARYMSAVAAFAAIYFLCRKVGIKRTYS